MRDSDTASDEWRERAKTYHELEWVRDDGFLRAFLDAAKLEPKDRVLDVGCGTGLLLKAIAPFVTDTEGIDSSEAMLEEAGIGKLMDVRDMTFQTAYFDKVLARMVLHHVTESIDRAMAECYRVLRPGGMMVIGEALPPLEEHREDRHFVRRWYRRVFRLKEERLTLSEYDLVDLLAAAGFREIHIDYYTIEGLSVANWLNNGGLPEDRRAKLWRAYSQAPERVARAYHLKVTEDDILINCRHAIITARKPGPGKKRKERKRQLIRCIPDLFNHGGRVLYIGASERADFLPELHQSGYEVTVLDIWFPNVWHWAADERAKAVIHGDVRNVGKMGHFDLAFWWHGPEHLQRTDTLKTLAELEKIANLVVIGCPDGNYPLGPAYGNPYEAHLSAWVPGDFRKIGYEAESLGGEPGTETCHILAWKRT